MGFLRSDFLRRAPYRMQTLGLRDRRPCKHHAGATVGLRDFEGLDPDYGSQSDQRGEFGLSVGVKEASACMYGITVSQA